MFGFFGVMFIIFSVFAGIGFYIAHRIYHGLVCFITSLPFWPVLVIQLILTMILILGFGRSMMPLSGEVKHVLGTVSAYCMGIFIYLLFFMVVADVLLLVLRLLKGSVIAGQPVRGYVTLGVLLLTVFTCLYGFINARQIDHVSYEVNLPGKTDISDMKIVMISDLHLGAVGSEGRLKKVVEEINGLDPDVVCIAGDFFDTDYAAIRDPEAAIETLQEIRSTFGVYACLGNHDAGQTIGQMTAFLEQAGIQVLNDAYTIIDDRLVLVGRLDAYPIGGYGEYKRKGLSDFLEVENPALPVIVMDHNPTHIDSYGTETDLILCGHTHKGQVFPANLVTNAMYAVDYGYYQKDVQSPHVIVTSGVGYWGMPMRVGTDCEIVSIRIQ